MKRFMAACISLILVSAMFCLAHAESFNSTLNIETAGQEVVSDGIEPEVPESDSFILADDGTSGYIGFEDASSEGEFAIEAAPLDADEAQNGDQVKGACAHIHLVVERDGPDNYPGAEGYSYSSMDGCNHFVTERVTNTWLYCTDCDTQIASYTMDHILSYKQYHSFLFEYEDPNKCSSCGQKRISCNHSSYNVYDVWSEAEYVNDYYHLCTYYDLEGQKVACCKKCHLLGMKWGGDEYIFGATIDRGYYDYTSQIEKHTFVSGKCSKCGYTSNASTTVKLNATSVTLGEKEKYKLTAKVSPSSKAKSVRYKSSNTKVATVNAKTGQITAKKAGTAKIQARIGTTTLATCKVTVKKAPETVTLNKTRVTLERGKTFQLKATPNEGTYTSRFTWTSSNKKAAKVNSKGKVTAVGNGTATITVKAANGRKATCKVTVKNGANTYKELKNYIDKTDWINYCTIRGGYDSDDCDTEIKRLYGDVFTGLKSVTQEDNSQEPFSSVYMKGKYVDFYSYATAGGYILTKDAPYSLYGFHAGMSVSEAKENAQNRDDIDKMEDYFVTNGSKTTKYYKALTTLKQGYSFEEVSIILLYNESRTKIERVGLEVFIGD